MNDCLFNFENRIEGRGRPVPVAEIYGYQQENDGDLPHY
jgi:hypothetical protein